MCKPLRPMWLHADDCAGSVAPPSACGVGGGGGGGGGRTVHECAVRCIGRGLVRLQRRSRRDSCPLTHCTTFRSSRSYPPPPHHHHTHTYTHTHNTRARTCSHLFARQTWSPVDRAATECNATQAPRSTRAPAHIVANARTPASCKASSPEGGASAFRCGPLVMAVRACACVRAFACVCVCVSTCVYL